MPATTSVTYSKDGSGAAGADVGVVVVGEEPYAEFEGDRTDLGLAAEDKSAIAAAKQAGIPVVVVLLSGRPMIVTDELAQADAFVAAWLPGHRRRRASPTCSSATTSPPASCRSRWPRSMAQIPTNVGDATYDPLFKYGYGLSY